MNDVTINKNGGNNQILPNATEAVQNFYGDQFAEKILGAPTLDSTPSPEVSKLSLYIDKVNLPGYISQIGECLNATEFAKVVISIFGQESKLTEEEIVKERFIRLLLPFAPNSQRAGPSTTSAPASTMPYCHAPSQTA